MVYEIPSSLFYMYNNIQVLLEIIMTTSAIERLPANAKIQKSKKKDYVYVITGYTKAATSKDPYRWNAKKEYIGSIEKGKFVPNARYLVGQKNALTVEQAELIDWDSKIAGPTLLLYQAAKQTGLIEDMQGLFSQKQINVLLTLAFFELDEGSSLYRLPGWGRITATPGGIDLSSSEITRILTEIGELESSKENFFQRRINRLSCDEYLSYDSTKLESEALRITDVMFGPTKAGGFAKEITVSVLCGHKSRMPVLLESSPGNLADISTVGDLIHRWEVMGSHPITFVFDRGYESTYNLAELKKANIRFLMCISISQKLVQDKIRETLHQFWEPRNHIDQIEGYGIKIPIKWPSIANDPNSEKIDLYLYLFRPSLTCAASEEAFYSKLSDFEQQLKQGRFNGKSKLMRYFYNSGDTDNPSWQRNFDLINEEVNSIGFFAFISSENLATDTAINIYRSRDWVEKGFNILQNKCDMDSLRVHKNQTLKAKLLVGFIAMTLVSYFYRQMDLPSGDKKSALRKNYSFETLLDEFKTVRLVSVPGHEPWLQNASKKLSLIADRLGLGEVFSQSLNFYTSK